MTTILCIRADVDEAAVRSAITAAAAPLGLRPSRDDEAPERTIVLRASDGAGGWIVSDDWTDDVLVLEVARAVGEPALLLALDEYEEGRAIVLRGGEAIDVLAWNDGKKPKAKQWKSTFGEIDGDALRAAADAEEPAAWLDELARAVGIAPLPFAGAHQSLSAQLGRFTESLTSFMQHAVTVLGRGGPINPSDLEAPEPEEDPNVQRIELCFTDELLSAASSQASPDFSWAREGTEIGDDAALDDEELELRYARGGHVFDAAREFQRAMSNLGRALEAGEETETPEREVADVQRSISKGPVRYPASVEGRGVVTLVATNTGRAFSGIVIQLDGPALREQRVRVESARLDVEGAFEELRIPKDGAMPLVLELPEVALGAGLVPDRTERAKLGPCAEDFEARSSVTFVLELEAVRDGTSELHVSIAPLTGGPTRLCRQRIEVGRARAR